MAELFDKNKRILSAFLVGVQTAHLPPGEGAELLAELRELVENLHLAITGSVLVNLRSPSSTFLLGRGKVAEVIAIGPPLMMRAVSDLTKPYGVPTVASLNAIMVDATGMCGACMVPVTIDGKMVRKHACIDGPELDAHIIDWDKFLPRFDQFKAQEQESRAKHGLV